MVKPLMLTAALCLPVTASATPNPAPPPDKPAAKVVYYTCEGRILEAQLWLNGKAYGKYGYTENMTDEDNQWQGWLDGIHAGWVAGKHGSNVPEVVVEPLRGCGGV